MMKIVMGFLGSYSEGLAPSRIPPWWGARSVLDGVVEAMVAVMTCVTVVGVFAAMLEFQIREVDGCFDKHRSSIPHPTVLREDQECQNRGGGGGDTTVNNDDDQLQCPSKKSSELHSFTQRRQQQQRTKGGNSIFPSAYLPIYHRRQKHPPTNIHPDNVVI